MSQGDSASNNNGSGANSSGGSADGASSGGLNVAAVGFDLHAMIDGLNMADLGVPVPGPNPSYGIESAGGGQYGGYVNTSFGVETQQQWSAAMNDPNPRG